MTKIHRILAECFIDNPNSYQYVNHLDGNKLNNHLDNLMWVTPNQNIQHAYDTGLKFAPKNPKLPTYRAKECYIGEKKFKTIQSALEYLNVSISGQNYRKYTENGIITFKK